MTHQLVLRKPLAFFDLETTGINTAKDRIVELCIMKAMPGGEVVSKTQRVNPGMPIPLESSLIHGIYDDDVKDAPPFKTVARNLAQFLEGCDLAGFNSNRFDVPLLVEEFLRANVDFDVKNRRLLDAQRIFHLMEPRNLSAAYKFYCDKDLVGAHGAEADTLATLEVLNAQVQRYKGQVTRSDSGQEVVFDNDMDVLHSLTANKNVDLAGRIILNNEGVEVFNFGKHKDRPVLDVLQKEPAFYDWMLKGEFPLDTKRRLTEIRLRMLTHVNGRK
ncbi:3'-5' exonuclease [Spirosoma montaniterrae]|uniref:DNA polymerase III subunit epsilon n=1 Tax=Spirosoma montaniterrae TaxID=1178516 RepID=A0A1P9X151_9BACT|nr:3'-5' exonuclease [Spirosoma montaniterrae]AQG81361.1 DNA polymerase III subunit epsilon [Spirosoma montaniterrae]